MNSWSPELELVARLARLRPSADDDARALALAATPLNWDRVLALTSHHCVAPLVDENLSRLEIATARAHFREPVRQLRLSAISADLGKYDRWLELCREFESQRIAVMTIKGFQVVLTVYGQVGRRAVGDLDLVVGRSDVAAAIGLLERMGYYMTRPWQLALQNVGLDHVLSNAGEIPLVSANGVVVDLHWKTGPERAVPTGEELIARAVRLRVEDQNVLVPPADLAMVLLLLHGSRSSWSRMRWLVDVVEGIERLTPVEYEESVGRLDDLGMRLALTGALQLIEDLWGQVPSPRGGSVEVVGAAKPQTLFFQRMVIERERDWAHIHDMWRPIRMLRVHVEGSRSLLAAIASASRPSHFDWGTISLPRPLWIGYYLVRPIRVLQQALPRPRRLSDALGRPIARLRRAFADRRVRAVPSVHSVPPTPTAPRRRETTALTFVTAIYDYGIDSVIGGRGWDINFYLPSLINIANMGAPIVVYCAPKDVYTIKAAIEPYFCDCRVIPYQLSQFEHFDQFISWKKTYWRSMEIKDRNEVLGYLKSYWLQQAIDANPFGHDRYFWIDSGVTNHGIFPQKVGGVELLVTFPPSHYFPRNRSNMFGPALGQAILNAVPRGKLFFCTHPFAGHPQREALEQLVATKSGRPRDKVRIEDHLVAGIFGGHRTDVRAFHRVYAELLKELIDSKTYCLEEMVFSCVNAVHPELILQLRFGTWHHYSPGEPTSYLHAEGDSFYKVFTRLLAASARD